MIPKLSELCEASKLTHESVSGDAVVTIEPKKCSEVLQANQSLNRP